jgi:hypothetical protein
MATDVSIVSPPVSYASKKTSVPSRKRHFVQVAALSGGSSIWGSNASCHEG